MANCERICQKAQRPGLGDHSSEIAICPGAMNGKQLRYKGMTGDGLDAVWGGCGQRESDSAGPAIGPPCSRCRVPCPSAVGTACCLDAYADAVGSASRIIAIRTAKARGAAPGKRDWQEPVKLPLSDRISGIRESVLQPALAGLPEKRWDYIRKSGRKTRTELGLLV